MNSLPHLLRERALQSPDTPFLFFKDQVWTLRQIDAASDICAERLRCAGVCKGDRAALLLSNGPEFIVHYFGTLKAGAIVVPINTLLKVPEVRYILENSGAKHLTLGPEHHSMAGSFEGVEKVESIELFSGPPQSHKYPAPLPVLSRTDLAAIIYTSGTTGFPKGATLSHGNYLWDIEVLVRSIKITAEDRFLCFLPLFHVNGQVVTMLAPLFAQGSMVLMEKFSPKEFLGLLSKFKCTAFSGVPSVYSVLLNTPVESDLSSLRFCICGAAPMPVNVFEAFEEKFNAHILEGYGLSEGSCVSSVNPPPPGKRKVGSIGLPINGQKMAIFDSENKELPAGEVGEIVVRGPNVMQGYWNNPEETREAIDNNGFLHTGDLGSRDEDGYFFIKGRKKEMIIRGGENIYPKEIEEILYKHAAIAEAAIVGLPHKRWGEEVAAFLVLKENEVLTAKELAVYLKEFIADYKLPRRVVFLDSLPKTATGKIQKHKLRESVAS
ncbi:MAG: long-chain-fatty-acid--CoA ligase [Elusimicrobia bacterium]|nr:MAG: long-chain-fatty-acid--CoA ligase [Elusimicrobiota bacterium]